MADLSESIWNLVLHLLKTLYLHYHNTFRHQNCRGGVLKWVAPTHNVTWPFHHMVLRDNVTNWKHYIFTTRVPMAIKLGRMVTYRNDLRSKKSEESCVKQEHLNLHYHDEYDYQTWQIGDLLWGATIDLVTWFFNHMINVNHCDKIEIYMYYHKTDGHQNWQGGDIQWEASSDKVRCFLQRRGFVRSREKPNISYLHLH